MKRIVNGYYLHPDSTRNLIEIKENEFEILLFSYNHLEKKYSYAIELPDAELMKTLSSAITSEDTTDAEKETLKALNPDKFRIQLQEDIVRISELKDIWESMKRVGITTEMIGISAEQWRVLIDCLLHTLSDSMSVVNMDDKELERAIKYHQSMEQKFKSEIDLALPDMKDDKKKEELYKKGQLLFEIIGEINIPFEESSHLSVSKQDTQMDVN